MTSPCVPLCSLSFPVLAKAQIKKLLEGDTRQLPVSKATVSTHSSFVPELLFSGVQQGDPLAAVSALIFCPVRFLLFWPTPYWSDDWAWQCTFLSYFDDSGQERTLSSGQRRVVQLRTSSISVRKLTESKTLWWLLQFSFFLLSVGYLNLSSQLITLPDVCFFVLIDVLFMKTFFIHMPWLGLPTMQLSYFCEQVLGLQAQTSHSLLQCFKEESWTCSGA